VSIGGRLRALAPGGELASIAGMVFAVAGLIAYVYVVGWIVDLAKLSAARLPASSAVAALSNRQLVGDGVRATLLMAGVFAVSCALAYFSSSRNWEVHGQDWHDIVRKHGVANAAADREGRVERRRRERRQARRRAARAQALAVGAASARADPPRR
jgi:hypothetical protein